MVDQQVPSLMVLVDGHGNGWYLLTVSCMVT